MKADEKACPMCAETIKRAALVCKHCGHKFSPEAVAKEQQQSNTAGAVGGCLVLGVVILFVAMCSSGGSDPEKTAAASAEERRKGFHCLSAWDGSSRQFVQAVKAQLRDPGSFEHEETRITPVNAEGQHAIIMTYRARNGFGGMNVSRAIGSISQASCEVTSVVTE